MKELKGVLFDMDGTLINTYENVNFKQAFSELKSVQKSLILKILKSRVKSFADFEAKVKEEVKDPIESEELILRVHQFLLEHYDHAPLKKSAIDFLSYLKENDYKICLCTNNATSVVEHVLAQKQLTAYFDYVITSQQVHKAKPDPQMYLEALHNIQLNPHDCMVFEDTESGVLAARNAGIKVIAVCEKDKKKFAQCDMIVRDFSDKRLYQLF